MMRYRRVLPWLLVPIVGCARVLGLPDWRGEDTDVLQTSEAGVSEAADDAGSSLIDASLLAGDATVDPDARASVCSPADAAILCKAGSKPQFCGSDGQYVEGPVRADVCGAVCDPGVTRCTSAVGQRCGSTGAWIANGAPAGISCDCYETGRFLVDGAASTTYDTKTGLTWDFLARGASDWNTASTDCDARGARLPTFAEIDAVQSKAVTATCSQYAPIRIDQSALPTSTTSSSSLHWWTSQVEGSGFMGYIFVAAWIPRPGGSATAQLTDQSTSVLGNYRCVRGPS